MTRGAQTNGGSGMKNRFGIGGAVLLILAATAGLAVAEEQGFTPVPVIKGVKLLDKGSAAPAFVVKDLAGQTFDFATAQVKKGHVLVFWSIFCEPCREEMPVIERIANDKALKDSVEVLAVNLDGDPFLEGIKGFVKQYKYTFTVLIDELVGENFKIADPYQVAGTPVLYLVDAKGQVFSSHLGRIAEADLRAMIADMLAQK
jgi:thiol-disulfide isomerase/thioredoxin